MLLHLLKMFALKLAKISFKNMIRIKVLKNVCKLQSLKTNYFKFKKLIYITNYYYTPYLISYICGSISHSYI